MTDFNDSPRPQGKVSEIFSLRYLDPVPESFSNIKENSDEDLVSDPLRISPSLDAPIAPNNGDSSGTTRVGRSSSVYYLIQLQKISSYAFTVFTTLHLTNTSLVPLFTRSISDSETYLLLTRPYYQSFPLEAILISLPIAVHVTAGIILRLHRRKINLVRYGAIHLPISERLERRLKVWPTVSWPSMTGYLLLPLVGTHALVNRILPWVYEGGSSSVGLGYVAHTFAKHQILTTVSYVTLISAAASHFSWGFCRWNGLIIAGDCRKARRRRWAIHSMSAVLAITWMVGGLGIVARGGRSDGWVGKGYDMLLKNFWL